MPTDSEQRWNMDQEAAKLLGLVCHLSLLDRKDQCREKAISALEKIAEGEVLHLVFDQKAIIGTLR